MTVPTGIGSCDDGTFRYSGGCIVVCVASIVFGGDLMQKIDGIVSKRGKICGGIKIRHLFGPPCERMHGCGFVGGP